LLYIVKERLSCLSDSREANLTLSCIFVNT
jgi:hypothetical protein